MNFFEPEKPPQETPITFWSSHGNFGCFSNFSRHPITVDGNHYPTSEHYYQSQKFKGTKYEKIIREASGPKEAANEGRDKKKPLRSDWEMVKEDVMYKALQAKFVQHNKCREILLSTGNAKIIEASPKDAYWGWGPNRQGKNRLGVLLMRLRKEFRENSK